MRSGGSPLTAVSAAAPVPDDVCPDFAAPFEGVFDEVGDVALVLDDEHALGSRPIRDRRRRLDHCCISHCVTVLSRQ